ncbi:acyl-CoA dehydrogenase family protein [Streptomyces spiramenti]|uniref:Acyl-CoA/acyl-ACP dehydrogenase n=1 Tax=Streptomyces spiramenti TaxID=2720606 RepID=A0ABX1ATQ7_9ACTN|nr:acyl-CoA dehydrogenase family protein [Streptomyces spiramenti]NJP69116.1 acyl-CoA/acyl-ACP dehydrogenase [Streptomyces spiramenti]
MTTVQDPRHLARLRGAARELAAPLREVAPAVDRDPGVLPELVRAGRLPWREFSGLPAAYHGAPIRVGGRPTAADSCAEQAVVWEEMARADAGVALGLPGPAMSGFMVAELADATQRERYYGLLASGRPVWTFFGMTEPEHGSDPASMGTALAPDATGRLALTGTKRFIGNGARAEIGVVFARRAPGPLGLTAVLVDAGRPGFTACPLDTVGLRGLELSELRAVGVPVADADVLGRHLRASRRGMWAAVRTFNRFRPLVATLALGVAQAAHEYAEQALRPAPGSRRRYRAHEFADRLVGVRAMVGAAALAADRGAVSGTAASAAKLHATRLAEELTLGAVAALGPGARFDHPLLDKWVRDARAFEFMEGTSNIQRLNLAQGYLQERDRRAVAA